MNFVTEVENMERKIREEFNGGTMEDFTKTYQAVENLGAQIKESLINKQRHFLLDFYKEDVAEINDLMVEMGYPSLKVIEYKMGEITIKQTGNCGNKITFVATQGETREYLDDNYQRTRDITDSFTRVLSLQIGLLQQKHRLEKQIKDIKNKRK